MRTLCQFVQALPLAILARSRVPNDRLHQSTDKARFPVRSREGRRSMAAFAFARAMRKSFLDFLVRTLHQSRRCFRHETESFASSFRHPLTEIRRAPGSARKHAPGRRRKPCLRPAGPRESAQSAANPPVQCAPTFCRHPPTCTSHFRTKWTTACRLRPTRHKSPSNLTALLQSPQSMQWTANRRRASTFAPRHSFSKRLRPRFRNRKFPVAHARPSLPARALRAMARSVATAAPEIILDRIA